VATAESLAAADHAAVGRLRLDTRLRRTAGQRMARLYQRICFPVGGDLPMNFRLRYRRFRLDL
jgi:hypothetical protein